jgi:hypothetical protein
LDTIHNENETMWHGVFPEEKTYQIENFLSEEEIKFIINWYYKERPRQGFYLQEKALQFVGDQHNSPEVREILFPKIRKYFGDFKMYSELNNDTIAHSADFILEQTKIFGPHTDAITHIPGWLTQKDIIIPLWIENDAETHTYAMNQRCYMRATHFRKGSDDKGMQVYSNVLRDSYDVEGVTNLNGNQIDYDFIENHIGDRFSPSYFEGLTVETVEKNIPGNAIIKDSSVIHGPCNYNLVGSTKKINISIRMFKEVQNWKPDTIFSNINFEACNKRTYYKDERVH